MVAMMDNYFLISIIGLSIACGGALLGGYMGRKLAEWQIGRRDATREYYLDMADTMYDEDSRYGEKMPMRPDPSLMGYDERREYYLDLADAIYDEYKDDVLHGRREPLEPKEGPHHEPGRAAPPEG